MEILFTVMVFSPLVGSFFNGLVLQRRSARFSGVVATVFSLLSLLSALILYCDLINENTKSVFSFAWFSVADLNFKWGFTFDSLTALMSLMVTGVGTVTHLYSIKYLSDDRAPHRYFSFMNLILFCMLVVVAADNLAVLFVGWEGAVLCSYLLIGYRFHECEKGRASMKVFLVNQIGDTGFLMGMFMLVQIFGSLEFLKIQDTLATASDLSIDSINLACLLLFVGAIGKSAQIPLFVWLPEVVAGPLPVSALIQAATLATTGVFMVARMFFLFRVAQETSHFIALLGGFTAVLAATIATSQRNIMRVLAYSTVSQLGLMFLGLGAGAYSAAMFQLLTHAFFKALLLLGSGCVIHYLNGEQNICKMGGLSTKLPITFWTFVIGAFAISGILPLSGFFSNEAILNATVLFPKDPGLLWALGLAVSFLTAFYMARASTLVFLGKSGTALQQKESLSLMTMGLIVLVIAGVFALLFGFPSGLGLPSPAQDTGIVSEQVARLFAMIALLVGLGAGIYFYLPSERFKLIANYLWPVRTIFENKYFVDEFYDYLFVKPFQKSCIFLAQTIEMRIVDPLFLSVSRVLKAGGTFLSLIQSGSVQFYLLIMLLGSLGILLSLLLGKGI